MSNFTISDADLRSIIHIDSETKSKQNPQYIGTCPWCGKEKHFYINKRTQLFDCKKCGVNGSIYKLLKQLDKLYLIGDKCVEIHIFCIPSNTAHKAEDSYNKPILLAEFFINHIFSFPFV